MRTISTVVHGNLTPVAAVSMDWYYYQHSAGPILRISILLSDNFNDGINPFSFSLFKEFPNCY